MKCPKCAYLGYAHAERCRNCGYEFSLSASTADPDLRLHDRTHVPQPLNDLDMVDAATPAPSADRFVDVMADRQPDQHAQHGLAELPLFGPPITDDVPLITKASPPRSPLSVRRATPDVQRLRSEPRAPLLDWPEPPPVTSRPIVDARPGPAAPRGSRVVTTRPAEPEPAGFVSRAAATLIDVALLAIVDFVVVYFTLKICRLTPGEWPLLPKVPLLTFLLIQNGGYFVAFTTTGQTLGKMIFKVRVLAADDDHAPDLGRSAIRAFLWMILALPAGLGLLSATISRDGRGLHDRFAGTRVVRTGA
jgi:uncharacterized RDD family membrane protein YckC